MQKKFIKKTFELYKFVNKYKKHFDVSLSKASKSSFADGLKIIGQTIHAHLFRQEAVDDGEDLVEMRSTLGVLVPALEHQSVHLGGRVLWHWHSET